MEDMRDQRTAYVYIMASQSGTLYTGVTNDIVRRVHEHKTGLNPKSFTSQYQCKKLVYFVEIGDIGEAITFEKKIKGWKRCKKQRLIRVQNPTWSDLAHSWYGSNEMSISSSSF